MRSQNNPIAGRADSHQEGHDDTGHPGHSERDTGTGCESDSEGPAPAAEKNSQDVGARQGLDTPANEEQREQPLHDEKALPDQDGNSVRLSRTRSSQPSPPADSENLARLGSRMSTDPDGNVYPEGGLEAYLVVFGCFLCLFGSFGLVNTIGTFQAYLSENQLKDYNQSTISWIFGVFSFPIFFGGLQIGPIFDAKGPKGLVLVGSTLVIGSLIALGFCTEYWQIMVVFGVVCAAGTSMVFTPAVANPGHYFFRLRGRATGLAATGGSVGGIVFPLVLDALFTKIGFAWSTRSIRLPDIRDPPGELRYLFISIKDSVAKYAVAKSSYGYRAVPDLGRIILFTGLFIAGGWCYACIYLGLDSRSIAATNIRVEIQPTLYLEAREDRRIENLPTAPEVAAIVKEIYEARAVPGDSIG
ncbi:hypothetical protein TESG_05595 [Trichophyton tonsurans CBS 112818]|uniref:MFS monocarboxylate transporter n=1 Tax=Trichophyton tonsurans (strain CBS 112818) TaxID=647933 RepID=F2S3R4_TRIT1|nr:hypothetical protein TESG_05595 [Trichophyton tonsurans CBS 112818]